MLEPGFDSCSSNTEGQTQYVISVFLVIWHLQCFRKRREGKARIIHCALPSVVLGKGWSSLVLVYDCLEKDFKSSYCIYTCMPMPSKRIGWYFQYHYCYFGRGCVIILGFALNLRISQYSIFIKEILTVCQYKYIS